MSYFKSKMYQIRFRLRLRSRPRWGSLQRSPKPLAGFRRGATSNGKVGKGEEEKGLRGGERNVEKRGRKGVSGGEWVDIAWLDL